MKRQATRILTLMVLCLGASFTASEPGVAQVRSLRGVDAAQSDSAPEERREAGGAPGSQKRIARGFVGQPPLIPHSTAGLEESSLEESPCLSCHNAESAKALGTTPVSRSHYVQEKGKPTKRLDMRRHQCLACHVPQFDAPPLVDNTFRGAR